ENLAWFQPDLGIRDGLGKPDVWVAKTTSRYLAENRLQPGLQSYICRRPARPAEPCIKSVPSQAVLSAGFSRFHGELVQPLRFVFHLLTAAKALDCQSDGFVQRARL